MKETIPAGVARVTAMAPIDEVVSLQPIRFVVYFETVDGPGQVELPPERVRELGFDGDRVGGALVPTPTLLEAADYSARRW
ncbi:hypothetical protein FHS87_004203 [Roseomonas pecuniae]|uniref:Uncharacterized protein n=1 Tax=Muricoccus pecuniae TaxID=693023 RepID=A0A840YMC3_9PROT|nr:hypothetical protein [Roseomonas pecuniae]